MLSIPPSGWYISKYLTSPMRLSKQQKVFNIAYINQKQHQQVNMQTSSNETSPSDDDVIGDDNDDNDNDNDDEEHMDETDFPLIKNIIKNRNDLDNRKTTAANVFCCGDRNGVESAVGVIGKLLGHGKNNNNKKKGTSPGQAVQVITNEYGVTEILETDGMKSKRIKMAENV